MPINNDGGLWSEVRVNYGVENILVFDIVVENVDSFIAGPSTRNQSIERMQRDVLCSVVYVLSYFLSL